eukprot:scaffold341995_cov42-Prasinocladus_malaysianus.AAC.1
MTTASVGISARTTMYAPLRTMTKLLFCKCAIASRLLRVTTREMRGSRRARGKTQLKLCNPGGDGRNEFRTTLQSRAVSLPYPCSRDARDAGT